MLKILILGAGDGQIPLILKCKEKGFNVLVVSPNDSYPGIVLADHVYYFDVRDKYSILAIAQKENIDAVITDQLDEAIVTAAFIAEKLKLKGIGIDTSMKFTNKSYMRKLASSLGINVPLNEVAGSLDESIHIAYKIGYPVIIKPIDGASSKGVYKIDNDMQMKVNFSKSKSYSLQKKVLVEQFIEKEIEYCVEAYTRDFQVKNLAIGHRDYFKLEHVFIPQATLLIDSLSAKSDIERQVLNINKTLIKGFLLPFGITHGEYIVEKNTKKIFLVEIAARGGGVGISSDLIPACCGVDVISLLIEDATENTRHFDIKVAKGASAYFCYLLPEGKILKIENLNKISELDRILKVTINVKEGEDTYSHENKYARKGPFLVVGRDKKECYETLEEIKSTLKISVNTSQGVQSIIWN